MNSAARGQCCSDFRAKSLDTRVTCSPFLNTVCLKLKLNFKFKCEKFKEILLFYYKQYILRETEVQDYVKLT